MVFVHDVLVAKQATRVCHDNSTVFTKELLTEC